MNWQSRETPGPERKKSRARRSKLGFSLIEILISLGLMSVLGLTVTSINKIGFMGQKTVRNMDDSRILTNDMASVLSNGTACLNTFGPAATNNPSTGYTITTIKDSSGTTKYSVNSTYNSTVKLLGITVGGAGTDTRHSIVKCTNCTASSSTASVLVSVRWQQTDRTTNTTGDLYREFFLSAVLDSSSRIMTCTATSITSAGTGTAGYLAKWLNSTSLQSSSVYESGYYVGINTNAPTALLDLYGTAAAGHATIGSWIGSNTYNSIYLNGLTSTAGSYNILSSNSDQNLFVNRPTGYNIYFRENNTDQVTILNTSGNVGIGTASPSYKLHVASTSGTTGSLFTSTVGHGLYGQTTVGGSTYYGGYFVSGSYNAGLARADGYAFVGTGAVWATGASFFNQSDGRLKENVHPLEPSLEKLMKLRPVTYQWKPGTVSHELNGSKQQIGLIAQEVEEVYPEAVTFNKNPGASKLKNGEPSLDSKLNGNYGVAYSYLVPAVIKGIQELWQEFQAMKARVDTIYAHFQEYFASVSELKARLTLVEHENAILKKYLCTKDPQAGFCEEMGK